MKKVVINQKIQEHFEGLKEPQVGVLLGRVNGASAMGIGIIPTPKEKGSLSLSHAWVTEHVLQVERMLTGGIEVLGLYHVLPASQDVGFLQLTLKRLMRRKEFSSLCLLMTWKAPKFETEQYALANNQLGKPTRLESLIISFQNLSVQTVVGSWGIGATLVSSEQPVHTQLEDYLDREYKNIQQSRTFIDNKYFNGTGKTVLNKAKDPYTVAFFTELKTFETVFPTEKASQHKNILTLQGAVKGQSYLVGDNNTLQDAVQVIQSDICNSLRNRINILIDSDEDDSLTKQTDQQINKTWNLPRRVLFPFVTSGLNIHLCDYLLPDEDVEDTKARIKDLLGFQVENKDFVVLEEFPKAGLVEKKKEVKPSPSSNSTKPQTQENPKPESPVPSTNPVATSQQASSPSFLYIGGALILIFAILLGLLR